MIQRNALFIILYTLMATQLLSCWPQRRTRQQPQSSNASAPMSLCNVTIVTESRTGRPCFPDPKTEREEVKETSRVIFPGLRKNPPPSRINSSPSKLNFPDSPNINRTVESSPSKLNFPDNIVSRTGVPESHTYVPVFPINLSRGPSCAEGSTFCKEIDNYPSDLVAHLIDNEVQTFKEFFGDDKLIRSPRLRNLIASTLRNNTIKLRHGVFMTADETVVEVNLTQRIDVPDETPLCQSSVEFVYPKSAVNMDNKWLYIVNQDQFLQAVRIEMCIKEGSSCALTETLPIGYKTNCRQKFIYRKLLSINENGKALSDSFRFPSCCACYFRMGSISSRLGLSGLPTSPARGPQRGAQSSRSSSHEANSVSAVQSLSHEASGAPSIQSSSPQASVSQVSHPTSGVMSNQTIGNSGASSVNTHQRS